MQNSSVSVEIRFLKPEKVETVAVVGGARWHLIFVFTKTDCFFPVFSEFDFLRLRVLLSDLARIFRMMISHRPGNFPATMHLLRSMRHKFSDLWKNAFFDNPLQRRSKSVKNLMRPTRFGGITSRTVTRVRVDEFHDSFLEIHRWRLDDNQLVVLVHRFLYERIIAFVPHVRHVHTELTTLETAQRQCVFFLGFYHKRIRLK